jgi:hypothetical protein
MRQCSAKQCSVGLYVEKKTDQTLENPNMELTLVQNNFDTCHYGVLNEDWRSKMDVCSCYFDDIPRPILVSKINPFRFALKANLFKRSPEFCDEDEEDPTDDEVLNKMFLHFATNENLAHRMAIDLKKFMQISSEKDEMSFCDRYNLFRSANSE